MEKKIKIGIIIFIAIILVAIAVVALIMNNNPTNNTVNTDTNTPTTIIVGNIPTDVAGGTSAALATGTTSQAGSTGTTTQEPAKDSGKSAVFTVSNASGRAGKTVNVLVSVSKNSTMSAADLILSYDSTLLEVVSVTKGQALSLGLTDVQFQNIDAVTLSYINANPMNKAGVMMNITMKIKDGVAAQKTILNLEVPGLTNNKYENISASIVQGSITIKP